MRRCLAVGCISVIAAFVLAGCANNQGLYGGAGLSVSGKPVAKHNKRASAKTCRSIKRELNRFERRRETGSKAYDAAIARYIRHECDTQTG